MLPHFVVAFCIAPPSAPSSSARSRRPPRASAGKHAVRTSLPGRSPAELRQLATEAEASGARGVLALHGRKHCELVQLGLAAGTYEVAWPPGAPSWPFTKLPPLDDEDGSINTFTAAAALMASAEAVPGLADQASALLRSEVARGDLYAGAVLVGGDAVHVVCVSDPDDGACFDPELGGAEWSVSRYRAVHPPLAAWRAARDAMDPEGNVPSTVDVGASIRAPSIAGRRNAQLTNVADVRTPEEPGELSKASDFAPRARLVFGSGALDGVAIRMRDVARLQGSAALRAFCVAGWNEARMQPLNVEVDALHDAGFLNMVVGGNVLDMGVTPRRLRHALETCRVTDPHVIVAFGGGAVVDAAKCVAALLPQGKDGVEAALEELREATERGQREATVRLQRAPLPAILINGTIGSGASLAEPSVVSVERFVGARRRRHSIFVTWEYGSGVKRTARERTAIVDPRLVAPRRLNAADAAQGGLMVLASAMDTFLSSSGGQAPQLAGEALQYASDYVLQARREPTHSDGAARDWLLRAACAAALARDALGAPPLGLLLATALCDATADGPDDGCFRKLYARVIVAMIRVAAAQESLRRKLISAARVVTGDHYGTPFSLADWLAQRAEDASIPQARRIGLTRRAAERAIRELVASGAIRLAPHPALETVESLQLMIDDVLDGQEDER